jgi:16S rRNA (cytosine967-C5)-methyltransferase
VPTPARALAATVLARIAARQGTLGDALAAEEITKLDPRERAFLHELVLGTLRRRGWLDHVLGSLASRPLGRAAPRVRDALRLGAYQLLYLRVPPHAAVSESVALAREAEPRGGAAGFVNAVLRRLQREGPPPEPAADDDTIGWLTTAGSLPGWLAKRWLDRLGPEEAIARARSLLEPPPTGFRYNPHVDDAPGRAASAGLEPRAAAVPDAWEATDGRCLAGLAERGLVYIQDVGSQLVAHLAVRSGVVLDACAAPGGKALLIADRLGPSGQVVATEASPRRLRTLFGTCTRWGVRNVRAVGGDALHPPFRRPFDSILVDAPCSGLGTLARRPDVRWRVEPGDVERHAERQRAMLTALAVLVRPGGRLVYSTCSVEDEENEGVVRAFLEAHTAFELEELPVWAAPFTVGPFVKMNPARHRGDAFFAARLTRRR